jgi:hypothetical protein
MRLVVVLINSKFCDKSADDWDQVPPDEYERNLRQIVGAISERAAYNGSIKHSHST